MEKENNLIGQKFDRLLVIGLVDGHNKLWNCKCDCGKELSIYESLLLSGHSKSCGCLNNEKRKNISQLKITHGKTNTRLYGIWCGIKYRCCNEKSEHYNRYGGRGIKICNEWINSFENFYNWAVENGYEENLTIDRINVNGNYEPANCRWISQKEQVRNLEKTVYIQEKGMKIPVVEFCEKHNIYDTKYVRRKVKKGVSAEQILVEWEILRNHENYFDIHEAANFYSVCEGTIRNWYRKGKLKGLIVGQRLFICK